MNKREIYVINPTKSEGKKKNNNPNSENGRNEKVKQEVKK